MFNGKKNSQNKDDKNSKTSDKSQISHSRILVIEDENHIAEGIKLNLELMDHSVEVASNGLIGLEKWKIFNPDLIVLDIMMPEMDGHKVLEEIRKVDRQLPILILSAKNESVDKVKAFKGGVDDYLGKPFSLDEFILRIERLLLRSCWIKEARAEEGLGGAQLEEVKFGKNTVRLFELKANTSHDEINLTEQEAKLLKLFFENPNRPLQRQALLEAGWGYTQEVNTRTLDNFMVRFRKYFEQNPKDPKFFQSIRGVGYMWSPEGKK
ncbi:MAG: DNA-binding response regulator [Halobacteriovoraceae bacterium]|nr:DNA-binding response regulator [Halobacteriovoraceae bacterium]|tara:strand:+ start:76956 stop:77753 length:798 start_codon:yes stop_codon:yes gene_type:complete